jgi:tRNA (guanine-N7-)-methyltransferase
MTPGQKRALDEAWPQFGLNTSDGLINMKALFPVGPVVLEIGFGMGDSLLQMASEQPDVNFIGVEVHRPGVGHLLNRVLDAGLKNIRVFAEDSIDVLRDAIPDNGLDKIQIFFPDPWHKKKHHKRRLINDDFAQLLGQKLKPQGILHIATDWQNYAESIAETFHSWPKAPVPARVETKYERRGKRLDHDVFDFAFYKPEV